MERKKKKQWDDSRFALNHQMTKDRDDRDRIVDLQKAEKAAAAAELAQFAAPGGARAAARGPQQPLRARVEELEPSAADTDAPPLFAADAPLDKSIFTDDEVFSEVPAAPSAPAAPAPAPAPELPPPRQSGAVTVKFTVVRRVEKESNACTPLSPTRHP